MIYCFVAAGVSLKRNRGRPKGSKKRNVASIDTASAFVTTTNKDDESNASAISKISHNERSVTTSFIPFQSLT